MKHYINPIPAADVRLVDIDKWHHILKANPGSLKELGAYNDPHYAAFTDVQDRSNNDQSVQDTWAKLRVYRQLCSRDLPLTFKGNQAFTLVDEHHVHQTYHLFDHVYSRILVQANQKLSNYLLDQQMEESIYSCLLAGYDLDIDLGKELLLGNRSPKTDSEKILVNYHRLLVGFANQSIELSFEYIKSLAHQLLSRVYGESASSKRLDSDPSFWTSTDQMVFYGLHPDPECAFESVDACLKQLSKSSATFYHPLLKGATVMLALTYFQPFRFHNTLIARLAMYAILADSEYPYPTGISMSKWIYEHSSDWDQALCNTIFDDGDATYFIRMLMNAIRVSSQDIFSFIQKRKRLNLLLSNETVATYGLNKRQINTLMMANEDDGYRITATMYMNTYRVSWATAVNDLKKLDDQLLVTSIREGKNVFYYGNQFTKSLFAKTAKEKQLPRFDTQNMS